MNRIGHVIEWEYGSIRKIFAGTAETSWLHMPCEKQGEKYVIKGPASTECGGIYYYWITEERANSCRLLSAEEISEKDKEEMNKPAGPACQGH